MKKLTNLLCLIILVISSGYYCQAQYGWDPQSSGTEDPLYATFFLDVDVGWIAGANGLILHTNDGGTNWEVQSTGSSTYFSSIHFVDAAKGWVVGSEGTILHTSDGGQNWEIPNQRSF